MGEVFEVLLMDDPTQRFAMKFVSGKKSDWIGWFHRFHQEAALMSQLYHSHVISLKEYGFAKGAHQSGAMSKDISSYFIAMDFVDGNDLKHVIGGSGKKGMSLDFFFQVASQMASALDYAHGKNIIHRDVKPHNIIVETQYSSFGHKIHARLIDFGVASLGEATNYIGGATAGVLDKVAGTPLYMAPEITERESLSIDHRIDLYSLGCVLYEVLVGKPPFLARTRAELEDLHSKAAAPHITSIRQDVPKIVGDIVAKLLAKSPDDRYQTAFSLYSDLKVVQAVCEKRERGLSAKRLSTINLGLNNNFRSMGRNYKLIGRTRQVSELIQFYSNVAYRSARGHISLVTGKSGMGKSRLLREFKEYLVKRKVKFISCGFMKYKSSTSMQSFISGFDEYLLKVRRNNPLEAKKIRDRLHKNLGDRILLLKEVVPATALFTKKSVQAPTHYSIEDVDRNVIIKTFTDFTRSLISSHQPIVFIFDDIDFADDYSLKIIEGFFNFNNSERIHIVLSCTTEKGNKREKHVSDFLNTMSKYKRRYQEIELTPLTLHQTSSLVYHILGVEVEKIIPLCTYLYEVCRGNPIYLIEKIRDLVLNGDICHDFELKSWVYNLDEIRLINRPLISVDLILSRLTGYSKSLIRVLEVASISGMQFREDVLSVVGGVSHVRLREMIIFLESESLIREAQHTTKKDKKIKNYQFVHPHIRDVILGRIEPADVPVYHLGIVKQLCAGLTHPDNKMVFAVANHYYQGLRKRRSGYVPDKNTLNSSVYYASKAGLISTQMEEYYCAMKYYDFVIYIVNKYLIKSISINNLFMIYLQSCKILFHLGLFKKASRQLNKIVKIIQKKSIGSLPQQQTALALDYYLLILHRVSDYRKMANVTRYLISGLGMPLSSRWNKPLMVKSRLSQGVYYDYAFFVLGLKWASSPTGKIISRLSDKRSKKTLRVLKYYNYFYMSMLNANVSMADDIHLLSISRLDKSTAHLDDIIALISFRLAILKKYGMYKTIEVVIHCIRKIIYKNNVNNKSSSREIERYAIIMDYLEFCYFLYPGHHSYLSSKRLISGSYSNVLNWPNDLMYIIEINAINLTRLLLQGKKDDFLDLYHSSINICSSKTAIFPYMMLLSILCSAVEDDVEDIHSFASKVVYDSVSNSTYKKNIFFTLSKAFVLLVEDQYNSAKKVYSEAIMLAQDKNNVLLYHSYQMDLFALCVLVFQDYYALRSRRSFDKNENVLSKLASHTHDAICPHFFDDSPVKILLNLMLAVYSSDKKSEESVVSSFNKVKSFFAKNHYRIPFVFVLLKLGHHFSLNKHPKLGSKELLHALSVSRRHRYLAFSKMAEDSLLCFGIPFARRDLRRGVEKTFSRFDEFPSTLAYGSMLNFFPKISSMSERKIILDVVKLFQDSYGGDILYAINVQKLADYKVHCDMTNMSSFEPAPSDLKSHLESYLTTNEALFISIDGGVGVIKKEKNQELLTEDKANTTSVKDMFSDKSSVQKFPSKAYTDSSAASEAVFDVDDKTRVSPTQGSPGGPRRDGVFDVDDKTRVSPKHVQISVGMSGGDSHVQTHSDSSSDLGVVEEKTVVSQPPPMSSVLADDKTRVSGVVKSVDQKPVEGEKVSQFDTLPKTVVAKIEGILDTQVPLKNFFEQDIEERSKTVFLDDMTAEAEATSVIDKDSLASLASGDPLSQMDEACERMGCLIPIYLSKEQRCYIFIDKMGESHIAEEDHARSEINLWGAQAGYAFSCFGLVPFDPSGSIQPPSEFTSKQVLFESCSWLQLFAQDKFLRSESGSWVLGVNLGPRHYMLMSFDMKGSDEAALHHFASILWHYVYVLRHGSQYIQQKVSVKEVMNDMLYFLKNHPLSDTFNDVKSVITVFDRSYKRVESAILGELNARVFSASRMSGKDRDCRVLFRFSDGGVLKSQYFTSTFEEYALMVFVTGPADWSSSLPFIQGYVAGDKSKTVLERQMTLKHIAKEFSKTSSAGYYDRVQVITCMFSSQKLVESQPTQTVTADQSLSA